MFKLKVISREAENKAFKYQDMTLYTFTLFAKVPIKGYLVRLAISEVVQM